MPNRDMTGTGGPTPTGSTTGSSTTGSSTAGSPSAGNFAAGSSNTGSNIGSSVDEMKKTVNRAADDVMSTGRETLGNAQGRIRSLLEQQTGRAADQLGGVANALHKAAEQLNQENGGVVADYAEQAAGRVERVADMLRDANVDDIVGEVESFARRQPEVFIGAAFAVGFLAARFIKSSSDRRMHRASTSLRGNAHPSQTVRTARGASYDTGRDQNRDMGRGSTPSRGMAGGIGESVSRSTPSHSADTPTTGSSSVNTGHLAGRMESERGSERLGEPKPAAGRIGMPLSTAPASVTGRSASPSADTALGTSTLGTPAGVSGATGSAGSTANSGTTGISGTQGGAAGTASSTSKPQGQRP
ncbi:hypothetical protein J2848_004066 [Azospirillum lipoferum]|uniref:Nutrient deprivation-induced protein n=1 Tax=Azospirillum lipoferum TaxID=193 RepID=A0A5A9G618_AZOLI|nr:MULTISPECIES: hypothetical protein [Azospirillum]KAA0589032.1 hypothetical protein FZ942_32735 [Azospirillum lipoferum]MCP1612375.1 hypothetical protein [Azospirillum lipoferum]MDW5531841.1 hypothetical protein [Azospirillum sp. NL1]